jgi:hypothetical protein
MLHGIRKNKSSLNAAWDFEKKIPCHYMLNRIQEKETVHGNRNRKPCFTMLHEIRKKVTLAPSSLRDRKKETLALCKN